MNGHKFELGNVVRCTKVNGTVIEGVITDTGYNLMSWDPDYSVTSEDGIRHICVPETAVELVKGGDNRSEQEIKDYNMFKQLQKLGF